jgi:hypothetical protein
VEITVNFTAFAVATGVGWAEATVGNRIMAPSNVARQRNLIDASFLDRNV